MPLISSLKRPFFSLFPDKDKEALAKDAVTSTKMDEPPPPASDLTNPDIGLDFRNSRRQSKSIGADVKTSKAAGGRE